MKLLYLAQNTIEANIIKYQLSELNIDVFLSGSNLEVGVGELPVETMFTKVFVGELDFNKANSFIMEYKQKLKDDNPGNWHCSKCNEETPNSISICWNCGNEN